MNVGAVRGCGTVTERTAVLSVTLSRSQTSKREFLTEAGKLGAGTYVLKGMVEQPIEQAIGGGPEEEAAKKRAQHAHEHAEWTSGLASDVLDPPWRGGLARVLGGLARKYSVA